MKDYFNATDRDLHIIVIAMQSTLRRLTESKTLTSEERKYYRMAASLIEKTNGMILDRLGRSYTERVLSTTEYNDLRLTPKCLPSKSVVISKVSEEKIKAVLDHAMMECLGCERCDWQECPIYGIAIASDMNPKDTDGCPFKL